jgi:hypothetical protein
MATTFTLSQPVKMKSAIRDLWLDLLVSGQYDQTQSVLQSIDGGFCCLGVLCDIHANVAPSNKRAEWIDDGYYIQYDGETAMPSLTVGRWAFPELKKLDQGFLSNLLWNEKTQTFDKRLPDTPSGRAEALIHHLSMMNDREKTFVQIAKIIEANTVGV